MRFAALAAIAASVAATTTEEPLTEKRYKPESEVCTEGQVKGVSLVFNNCGESCVSEKWYLLYKLFEWGMFKAESLDEPACANRGFHTYQYTDTHTIPLTDIGISVDFYLKDGATTDITQN